MQRKKKPTIADFRALELKLKKMEEENITLRKYAVLREQKIKTQKFKLFSTERTLTIKEHENLTLKEQVLELKSTIDGIFGE